VEEKFEIEALTKSYLRTYAVIFIIACVKKMLLMMEKMDLVGTP
jgi:hypothetical protein